MDTNFRPLPERPDQILHPLAVHRDVVVIPSVIGKKDKTVGGKLMLFVKLPEKRIGVKRIVGKSAKHPEPLQHLRNPAMRQRANHSSQGSVKGPVPVCIGMVDVDGWQIPVRLLPGHQRGVVIAQSVEEEFQPAVYHRLVQESAQEGQTGGGREPAELIIPGSQILFISGDQVKRGCQQIEREPLCSFG